MYYIFQLDADPEAKEPVKSFKIKNALQKAVLNNEFPFTMDDLEVGLNIDGTMWCCGFSVICSRQDCSTIIDWLLGRGFGLPKIIQLT
jgi:hypothetical protein